MSILTGRLGWNALSMQQTNTSPSTLGRRRPASRVRDLARFASRINRGMKVDFEQDLVIITPSGDLGTLRYQELHLEVGRINDLLRHGGFENLLIDLSERRRIEHVILMALVGFCRSIPGKAALCSVSNEIRQSMEIANLLSLWPIHTSRAEGLRAIGLSEHTSSSGSAEGLDA